jgi:hypothetical protein
MIESQNGADQVQRSIGSAGWLVAVVLSQALT